MAGDPSRFHSKPSNGDPRQGLCNLVRANPQAGDKKLSKQMPRFGGSKSVWLGQLFEALGGPTFVLWKSCLEPPKDGAGVVALFCLPMIRGCHDD